MSTANLVRIAAVCSVLLLGCFSQAHATSVTVGYSTTALAPITFQGDSFSLAGQSGALTLDSVLSTTAGINAATFTTGHSGNVNVSESLTLSYDLTLDGVTQLVSQPATWTVTVPGDSFVALAASSPVLFVTPVGSWEVTLNAYSFAFPGPDLGVPASLLTTATFAPVPEPSSLALIVAGVMVFLGLAVKKAIA